MRSRLLESLFGFFSRYLSRYPQRYDIEGLLLEIVRVCPGITHNKVTTIAYFAGRLSGCYLRYSMLKDVLSDMCEHGTIVIGMRHSDNASGLFPGDTNQKTDDLHSSSPGRG